MDGQEPREISGLTTALILSYVERQGGREAVEAVLAGAGMDGEEEALRDDTRWFADARRRALFAAATDVLGDPELPRHIGESAMEFNVGQGLKLALRGLGSPQLVYRNVERASAKFNLVQRMSLIAVEDGRATLESTPAPHIGHHLSDCQYTAGTLACVPEIFGLPAARVRHSTCIGQGASACVFEVDWQRSRFPARRALAALAALAALVVGAVLVPSLLAVLAVAGLLFAAMAARRGLRARAVRTRALEARIDEQGEAAERVMTSLKDLVSALDPNDVLVKITENAQAAVGGAEFALLVREGGAGDLRARGPRRLLASHLQAIEKWAQNAELPSEGSLLIGDLRSDPDLQRLGEDAANPVGALCAVPLISRGEQLGVLVALSLGVGSFLPRDVVQLESYAAQAAIALTNARLYAAQQELAIEDPLTGLYNHRHFHETIARELDRCRRYGTELALVSFDLDGFKQVNDHDGHAAGDRVLRAVGAALRREGRSSDLAFRIGGDEFALVLPATGIGPAEVAAGRAAAAIDATDRRIRASWGVASWPGAGLTRDDLLTAADEAMYAMKHDRYRGGELGAAGAAKRSTASRSGEQLRCASRLAVRLAPLLDPTQIATVVVEEMLRSFPYHVAAILRADGGRLRTVAVGGRLAEGRPDLRNWAQGMDEGVIGRAARTGELVVVADTRSDPAFVGPGTPRDSLSELDVPIRVGGSLWGVLNLEHDHPDGFGPEDLLFAETVAAACGAAVHRSELYGELESAFTRTLAVLSDALEAKDSYTAAHARQVGEFAEKLAVRLGMDAKGVRDVGYAGLLHDIGKIGVRGEILHKPGALTEAEYEEVKRHTVVGAQMLERIPFFAAVHPIVRASHERWDGAGYPDRLAGDRIPLGARIIGACDAFHAMTSDRPYRAAMSVEAARAELHRGAGSQFDPEVVRVMLELLDDEPPTVAAVGPAALSA